MQLISDLHIHSRFARACSKEINFQNLEKYARMKGLSLLGTGDFQHPKWNPEILANLQEDDKGILWTKTKFPFIWQSEISLMYRQDDKGRRVHHVLLAPSKEVVDQIIQALMKKGRIDYDGRPIFGFTSIELVDMMQSISQDIEIIPAHCMTPYFGIFGSKTGFDSVEQCFKEKSRFIHAVESGMSADPEMFWQISHLDKYNIVSFSDPHSFWPWRIGREATIFDVKELSYKNIIKAIRTGEGLHSTIETDPAYGRYHWDGHKNCNISMPPAETKKYKGICPVCKKPLTIGVEYRVEELADRPLGFRPKQGKDFYKLIPLSEILAKLYHKGLATNATWDIYNKLVSNGRSEFDILINLPLAELKKLMDDKLADAIIKNREGKINIKPGYDGEYGIPIFDESEMPEKKQELKVKKSAQKSLGEF